MSSYEGKKYIASKLVILEEMLEPLQSLVTDINTLLEQGKSWIENIGDKTYTEMKQLLESEITEFLRRCFSIASNGQERFSEPALTKEQLNQGSNFVSVDLTSSRSSDDKGKEHILGPIEVLSETVTSHTKLLKTMQGKINNQEKRLQCLSKLKQQTEARFEEMMKEFNAASNFMSDLSQELKKTKEKKGIQDTKIQEVAQMVVNYLEQRDSFGHAIKQLRTEETKISELKKAKVTTNEVVTKKDKDKYRLIELEDFHHCIEIAKRISRGLNDKGVNDFWHHVPYEDTLSRRDDLQQYYEYLQSNSYTGAELKSKIEQRFYILELICSDETDIFWDEYIKCLNK